MTRDLRSTISNEELKDIVGLVVAASRKVSDGDYQTALIIAEAMKLWVQRNNLKDYSNDTTDRYQ